MILASHPPRRSPLGPPLHLQSRTVKLLETPGNGSDYDSPFRRFRQRPGELIAPGPTSHSKTTAAARGTARSKRIRGRGHLYGLERHHGWNDRLVYRSLELLGLCVNSSSQIIPTAIAVAWCNSLLGDRGYVGESYAICYTWTYL